MLLKLFGGEVKNFSFLKKRKPLPQVWCSFNDCYCPEKLSGHEGSGAESDVIVNPSKCRLQLCINILILFLHNTQSS